MNTLLSLTVNAIQRFFDEDRLPVFVCLFEEDGERIMRIREKYSGELLCRFDDWYVDNVRYVEIVGALVEYYRRHTHTHV